MNWRNFKADLAELMFAKELDEAYDMGIRIGAEYAARTISFRVKAKETAQDLTKTQQLGYAKANQIIDDCKEDIAKTTGAML